MNYIFLANLIKITIPVILRSTLSSTNRLHSGTAALFPGNLFDGINSFRTTSINGMIEPTEEDIFTVATKAGLNKSEAIDVYHSIHKMVSCYSLWLTHTIVSLYILLQFYCMDTNRLSAL